uniref:DUF4037 domain-containing protein n=1 Tax=Eubacterium cellulosolvens TaxID=29322 RepID=UPI0005579388|nr:DUF4037 domain-containing protein [[Eubacterium] cellulosolvens]
MLIDQLIEKLSTMDGVEAIALGGSRAGENFDFSSDYDLYVYYTTLPDTSYREQIFGEIGTYREMANHFWELEDDLILADGPAVDIVYRRIEELDEALNRVVMLYQAGNGYTTCLWHNLLNSRVLYDPQGKYEALRKKYDVPYPERLKRNIIGRNMRLIQGSLSSYGHQLDKAVARKDLVSINHRTAAFLESYFDVIFAMNELTHPGEKKLIPYALEHAKYLPENFEENLNRLFGDLYSNPDRVMEDYKEIREQLGAELQRYIQVDEKYRMKL